MISKKFVKMNGALYTVILRIFWKFRSWIDYGYSKAKNFGLYGMNGRLKVCMSLISAVWSDQSTSQIGILVYQISASYTFCFGPIVLIGQKDLWSAPYLRSGFWIHFAWLSKELKSPVPLPKRFWRVCQIDPQAGSARPVPLSKFGKLFHQYK